MPKRERNYLNYLTKREKKNIQKTRKYFSEEFEFLNKTFDMLVEVYMSIADSYSDKWSLSKRAGLFILPRLIMSTKTSIELLIRGYYFDHIVIERSLMEGMALFVFLSKDEEAAKKWLNFEKIELPKWKLMHQILPPPLSRKEMFKALNGMYATQSDYVHSSFAAVFNDFGRHINRSKKGLEFPKFEKSFTARSLFPPLSALLLLLIVFVYQDKVEKSLRMKVVNSTEEIISKWRAH